MKLTITVQIDEKLKPIKHTCTYDDEKKLLTFDIFGTKFVFDLENYNYDALDTIVSLFFRIENYAFPIPLNTTELAI